MYSPDFPEQLEKKGISPDLFEAAQDYALAVSEQKITYPIDFKEVDKFNGVLNQFVTKCVEAADLDPESKQDQSLRWVVVARRVLKECGKNNPKLKGFEKTRLFGSGCEDQQRQLYEEVIF